ncbi:hypothetical protein EC991_002714 [Linnemannia zychae]|nr:hypothetical protein EC991_002714 [Linnemannia zychae]
MLQTFCTSVPKRFLGVVIAYPAELAGVEGTFPEALDLLKGIKRQLDQFEGGQGGDDQKNEPPTKQRRCLDDDSEIDPK